MFEADSGLRKCETLTHKVSDAGVGETLTHKVFDAGVRSEEVGQRLRLGMAQQGQTVQLDDVVDSQGGCILDLPTTIKQQCDSVQGGMLGDGGRGGGGGC